MLGQAADEIVFVSLIEIAQDEFNEPTGSQWCRNGDAAALDISKGEMAVRMLYILCRLSVVIETQWKGNDATEDDVDKELVSHIRIWIILKGAKTGRWIEREPVFDELVSIEAIHQLKQTAINELGVVRTFFTELAMNIAIVDVAHREGDMLSPSKGELPSIS